MKLQPENRLGWLQRVGHKSRWRWLGGTVALAGALALLPACSNADTDNTATYDTEVIEKAEPTEATTEAQETEATIESLGEVVTVSGEVQAVFDNGAFIISNEEYFDNSDSILVVAINPDELEVMPGQYVEATGEVNEYVVTDLEKDYDLSFDSKVVEDIDVDFATGPVIIASSVEEVAQ